MANLNRYSSTSSSVIGAFLGLFGILLVICFYLSLALAWVTHVLVCIKASAWVLLVVGAVIFPIGVIHGFGVWLGLV